MEQAVVNILTPVTSMLIIVAQHIEFEEVNEEDINY
jgi:hypothetical protein